MRRLVSTRLPSETPPGAGVPRPSRGTPHRALADEIHAVVAVGGGLIRAGAGVLLGRLLRVTIKELPGGAYGWSPQPSELAQLASLVYELLDAHADTARMADKFTDDLSWKAHLEYLRALQRKGREVLARPPYSNTRSEVLTNE